MKRWSLYKRSLFKLICFGGLIAPLICLIISCVSKELLPQGVTKLSCDKVEVSDGPEDFVLDKWSSSPRLLISSYERREQLKPGDIYSFDLETRNSTPMKRQGETKKIKTFKPLGMDILHKNGETLLYVILHDLCDHSKRDENGIAIYRVLENELEFVHLLEDKKHLWHPNDLSVLRNGDIYVTNDFHNYFEVFFSMSSSEVVHYDNKHKTWSVVALDLALANGILAQADRVFASTNRGNQLIVYPRNPYGSLGKGNVLSEIKGLDNIMPYDNKLLIPAHYDDLAFLKHSRDKEAKSPSVVFLINPEDTPTSTEIEAIYVNEGDEISAVSTAFIYDDKLYLSQVFDPFILICDLDNIDLL